MKVVVEEVSRNQQIHLYADGVDTGWADITFVWYDIGEVMMHVHREGQGSGKMLVVPNGTPVEVR